MVSGKAVGVKTMFIIIAKWQTAEIRTERLSAAENHRFREHVMDFSTELSFTQPPGL